ncbi:MAG: LacI family transcriptional regulator [Lachnospiraceae bacterium]|nr:LacI family transcriptional regulator [Lachnospiraceae bacterium]
MTVRNCGKPRRVTRNDVAELAGVSPAVVSYVINSSKFVSEEKTRAVREAIEELQYRPNMQARGLRINRSMQIAFVCDNLRNDWLEDAEKLLFEKGYYVSHCYSRDGEEFIQMLIARQFDGVFMMSNRFSTAQLNEIAEAGIPIVLYKTRNYGKLNPNIVTLVPDLVDGVIKSVNYLAMKGHERIALIPPLRYKTTGLSDDGFRVRAYMDAMKKNGLSLKEELICTHTESMETICGDVFNMLANSDKDARPTALITGNDYIAVHLIQYIKKLGLRVPDDVAVMGVDNTYLATVVTPQLTTMDFSKEEFSEKLASIMLNLLAGKVPPDEYLKVSIVVRESA